VTKLGHRNEIRAFDGIDIASCGVKKKVPVPNPGSRTTHGWGKPYDLGSIQPPTSLLEKECIRKKATCLAEILAHRCKSGAT
jgi:hypothetical protein